MIITLFAPGPGSWLTTPLDASAHALVVSGSSRVRLGALRRAVSVNPNGNLPGTAQLTSLVGGLMTWVLLACVVAVLAGAATWGFGSRSGHLGASQQGRMMVLGGALGAMITGAATALVNFGFGVGGTVH